MTSEVGKGTSFEIRLPILAQKEEKLARKNPITSPFIASTLPASIFKATIPTKLPPPKKDQFQILIIEDNLEMQNYIRQCLGKTTYFLYTATNGIEGIRKAKEEVPDLIISDVMMPKKDGFAVLQAIREHIGTSHIPVILLTAKTALESRLKGLKKGADAYLNKPFHPEELLLLIDTLIENRRLVQQRYQNDQLPQVALPTPFQNERPSKDTQFVKDIKEYIIAHIDDQPKLTGDVIGKHCLLYTSPSPRDQRGSRMPSSA